MGLIAHLGNEKARDDDGLWSWCVGLAGVSIAECG